jgi:hypothetical protein
MEEALPDPVNGSPETPPVTGRLHAVYRPAVRTAIPLEINRLFDAVEEGRNIPVSPEAKSPAAITAGGPRPFKGLAFSNKGLDAKLD